MIKRVRVGILFGGKSAEHEISLLSARNVLDAIDKERYEPVLIGIAKDGRWRLSAPSDLVPRNGDPGLIALDGIGGESVALTPECGGRLTGLGKSAIDKSVDVVFPILHGPFGEDGTIQGLLRLARVPCVGAGVLGSAVGLDKDVMKRLLREAGIPVPRFRVFRSGDDLDLRSTVTALGLPLFVKPANLGSSIGISKVKSESDLGKAVHDAFRYDRKILIEEAVEGREIECGVLGNAGPTASLPGEILPAHDFYDYQSKYLDEQGARLDAPAILDEDTVKRVQDLAVRTFKALECEGMARVDCFLKPDGELLVNEINTIPGFTTISMYPRLWALSGVSYTELIDRLIRLAMERFEREQHLSTSR